MMMTRSQAENIAALVAAIRLDWDTAGVLAVLRKLADRDLADVARAAITAATDPRNRTPAVIALAGPHWPTAARREWVAPPPPRLSERCPTHLGHLDNCPGCRADQIAGAGNA
jgi:hypothetical protein